MFLSSRYLEVVSGVRVWVANPHYVGYRGNDAGRRVGRVYIYDLTRVPGTTDKKRKDTRKLKIYPCIEWIPPGLTFGHCRSFGVSSFPFGKNSG